jgi:hypothetical protein
VIPRFSLVPGAGATPAADRVLALAEDDASILRLDRGPFGQTLVFCPSRRVARAEQLRFDRAGRVAAGLCALTIAPDGPIAVEGGGSDESSERLARFVRLALGVVGSCRVIDDETGDDLTTAVARAPHTLFASLAGESGS